jgi:hypothetical protein
MNIDHTTARARAISVELIGTAKSLSDFAVEDEINDPIFCDELKSLAFECDECGWWCGEEERNGVDVCDECTAGNDVGC